MTSRRSTDCGRGRGSGHARDTETKREGGRARSSVTVHRVVAPRVTCMYYTARGCRACQLCVWQRTRAFAFLPARVSVSGKRDRARQAFATTSLCHLRDPSLPPSNLRFELSRVEATRIWKTVLIRESFTCLESIFSHYGFDFSRGRGGLDCGNDEESREDGWKFFGDDPRDERELEFRRRCRGLAINPRERWPWALLWDEDFLARGTDSSSLPLVSSWDDGGRARMSGERGWLLTPCQEREPLPFRYPGIARTHRD